MNAVKSIALATILATASGLAQAQRIEHAVERYGRGAKPAQIASTVVTTMAGVIEVSAVQGRSAGYARPASQDKGALLVTERSVDVYGRS
jgi:hypothetical protein